MSDQPGARRAGSALARALALACALAAGPWTGAAAQEPPRPTRSLEELRPLRVAAERAYLEADERARGKLRARVLALQSDLATKQAEIRALEAGERGGLGDFFRDYQLERKRREARQVSDELAEAQHKLRSAQTDATVRRLDLIDVLSELALRELQVAARVRELPPVQGVNRLRQSQDYVDDALVLLERVENLESMSEPSAAAAVPPPEDPRSLADGRLASLIEVYGEELERAERQAAALSPRHEQLEATVRQLADKVGRYANDDLPRRLAHAQARLERCAQPLAAARERAADYRARIAALEAERARRAAKPAERS